MQPTIELASTYLQSLTQPSATCKLLMRWDSHRLKRLRSPIGWTDPPEEPLLKEPSEPLLRRLWSAAIASCLRVTSARAAKQGPSCGDFQIPWMVQHLIEPLAAGHPNWGTHKKMTEKDEQELREFVRLKHHSH